MNLLSFSNQGQRRFSWLIGIAFIFITISACSKMQSNRAENILPKLTAQNDFFVTNWQLTGPLIGNQYSNSLIKEIYPQLPLKVNTDYLKLNNKKYQGKALGYWLAMPNPQNPKQSILLIGGNNLSKVKPRKGIPAEDGCYEFELVEYKGNLCWMLDQGYLKSKF